MESSSPSRQNVFVPGKACLDGRDITDWLTEGYKLTSEIYVKGTSIFYVTTEKVDKSRAKLFAVFEMTNGMPYKQLILDSKTHNENKPEQTLQGMVINDYDIGNAILFFSTDAWAQSGAIHAIYFKYSTSIVPTREKFITDGEYMQRHNNDILVQKIKHDDQGAYFPVNEVNMNGKDICQIDTRSNGWTLMPTCLNKGDVYKPR